MAKNHKYQPATLRFGPAIKAALLCIFFGGAGIGYVWQKTQIQHLADQIKRTESRSEELHRQNDKLMRAVAVLCSPHELDERVKKMNLGLVPPQPDQIVRLRETEEPPSHPGSSTDPRIRETVQKMYAIGK